ncbi:MAG: extracellular solute-binding protein [Phycisphaerae bacterium]
MQLALAWTILLAVASALIGCGDRDALILYCSVDETFGKMVLDRFERTTGLKVEAVYDTEAGKTTGLISRIRAEADRPRADVFFSGEVFHTVLIAREGLLEPYAPKTAGDIPVRFKDPQDRWTGIGLRGRVVAFDTKLTPPEALPARWEQLAEPAFAAKTAFANPLFGTTSGHVAAMFALWGSDRGRAFLLGLRDGGAKMEAGNSSAVRSVMAGRVALCMTDTDDVRVARQHTPTLDQRFLDLGDGGTLFIPTTVALIKGCAHPESARRLIDFLVSAEVERLLARSASGNIPVRADLRKELGLTLPPTTQLSYDRIADALPVSTRAVREILIR